MAAGAAGLGVVGRSPLAEEAVALRDAAGSMRFYSAQAELLWGKPAAAEPPWETSCQESDDERRLRLQALVQDGFWRGTRVFKAGGRGQEVTARWWLIQLAGTPGPLLLSIAVDIAAHEQTAPASQRLEAQPEGVDNLTGGAARDLNELLTEINASAELLLGQLEPDSPLRDALQQIARAGAQAARLAGQLPALSQRQQTAAQPAPAAVAIAEASSVSSSSRRPTVLLVEDEAIVRRWVSRVLARAGFQVLMAADAAEALAISEQQQAGVDLLLTDVVLPKMNGKELYLRLQRVWPRLKILYMSGYEENVLSPAGERSAGLAFLQKPFSAEQLRVKLQALLSEDEG